MKPQVVSFHCVLKNTLGKVLSSTFNHDVITEAGDSSVLRGLAQGLRDLRKGEKRRICLSAPDAYGYYDPGKVITRARDEVPASDTLKIGDRVMVVSSSGTKSPYRVIEATDERVTLDGNHPLAGQDLIFEIEATDARDATRDEILESILPDGALHQLH